MTLNGQRVALFSEIIAVEVHNNGEVEMISLVVGGEREVIAETAEFHSLMPMATAVATVIGVQVCER